MGFGKISDGERPMIFMIHAADGREWVRLSALKEGDLIVADGGFDCMAAGSHYVKQRDGRLYVTCRSGMHFLDGQADDGDHLVGFLPPPSAEELLHLLSRTVHLVDNAERAFQAEHPGITVEGNLLSAQIRAVLPAPRLCPTCGRTFGGDAHLNEYTLRSCMSSR